MEKCKHKEKPEVERGVMRKSDYHTHCQDCGQFLKKDRWVAKDHPWKQHGLCDHCYSCYDDPKDNY